jgi:hypothetical protein
MNAPACSRAAEAAARDVATGLDAVEKKIGK